MHAPTLTPRATTRVRAAGHGPCDDGPVSGVPLEFRGLTKRFGQVQAVTDLTLTVPPGRVTGFLGPNGAGKTTSLRCLLGLVTPTSGEVLVGGRRYADLERPLHSVGAVLESSSFHPGRSARNHLRWVARAAGLPVVPRRRGARRDRA